MSGQRAKVVVITGASSGIGREAAVQFAQEGFCVVVAARRKEELERTARLCHAHGAETLVVPTDVTSEQQVEALAKATLERFGRIDVWINNAGVALFSPLEEASFAEHRRVIETNLFGPMFAARVVVPIFRSQKAGIFVNVGSVLSKIGQAFVPSYVISKFALRGLSEALRVELADEPDIHVCSLFPYAVDSPHFESAANELGRTPFAMPPMQSAEKVARALVQLVKHPRRERHVPRVAALGLALHWLRPRTVERVLLHALESFHLQGAQPTTRGNLWRAKREPGKVHGERPPRIDNLHFGAWVVREMLKVELSQASHGLRKRAAQVSAHTPW